MYPILRKICKNSVNVSLGAALNRHPVWSGAYGGEQMMVPHEANKSDGWKLQRAFVCIRTPDSCRHGNEVVISERLGVPLSIKILADTLVRELRGLLSFGHFWVVFTFIIVSQNVGRKLVESNNVEDQPPHPGTEQVLTLCKDTRHGCA